MTPRSVGAAMRATLIGKPAAWRPPSGGERSLDGARDRRGVGIEDVEAEQGVAGGVAVGGPPGSATISSGRRQQQCDRRTAARRVTVDIMLSDRCLESPKSRKRRSRPAPRAVSSSRRDGRRCAPPTERRRRRGQRQLGREGERPEGPFGGLPVSELAILLGVIAAVFGFLNGGGPALVVGLVVCAPRRVRDHRPRALLGLPLAHRAAGGDPGGGGRGRAGGDLRRAQASACCSWSSSPCSRSSSGCCAAFLAARQARVARQRPGGRYRSADPERRGGAGGPWNRRAVARLRRLPGRITGGGRQRHREDRPAVGRVGADAVPPCCSVTWRTIARPRPLPCRPREFVPRKKRSNTWGRSASATPGAVIAHAYALGVDAHLDRSARRGVAGGVVEQVVDGAAETLGYAVDEHRLQLGVEADPRGVAAGSRQRFGGHSVQADVVGVGSRLIAPGQLDEIVDQRAELLGLLDHVGEQPPPVLGSARPPPAAPRCSCAGWSPECAARATRRRRAGAGRVPNRPAHRVRSPGGRASH